MSPIQPSHHVIFGPQHLQLLSNPYTAVRRLHSRLHAWSRVRPAPDTVLFRSAVSPPASCMPRRSPLHGSTTHHTASTRVTFSQQQFHVSPRVGINDVTRPSPTLPWPRTFPSSSSSWEVFRQAIITKLVRQ